MSNFDTIRQTWMEQQFRTAAQLNSENASEFLNAVRNWSLQISTQGKATMPKPIAPKAVEAVIVWEPVWSASFPETAALVSNVNPDSYLPTYGTDVDGIGGPVGGLNPEGNYYQSSTDTMGLGQMYTDPKSGRRFVKVADNPFKRYWLELK